MSVVYSKVDPCLRWGLSLTGLVGACFGGCDLYCMHAPATVPLPVHMYGPALCIGLCRYIPLDSSKESEGGIYISHLHQKSTVGI